MNQRSGLRKRIACACLLVPAVLAGCQTQQKIDPNHPDVALRAGADRGDPNAAVALGLLYENGIKVPLDYAEARKWFQSAADKGSAAGEYELGLMYQNGRGIPVDLPFAVRWYEAASDHNFAPAKASLGLLYWNGQGVPKDQAKGEAMIHDAAVQGFALAQMMLAALYLGNNSVVPTDDSLAYEWASLAASKLSGTPQVLSTRERDEAQKGLSPAEIDAAQKSTGRWVPGMDVVSLFPPGSPPRPARVRGQGSGFVAGKGGEIVTDYHVVPNCREIRIKDPGNKFNVSTHVVAEDRDNDVAVLAAGGFGTPLKLRAEPPVLGETIVTYGFPLGPVLATSGNLTTGSISANIGMGGNVKSFQITAPVQVGSSGGPVVDQSGAVIGMVAAKLNTLAVASATGDVAQNVNFAWRADALEALLNAHGIGFDMARGKAESVPMNELVNELQKGTVKVECWR